MSYPDVELIMSEFKTVRLNSGGNNLDIHQRLNPTLDSFLEIFPKATVTLYSDTELRVPKRVRLIKVIPPYESSHSRYGWRAHDYYQVFGLLSSKADVAVAMDSDMKIVSHDFEVITVLAKRFGLALPMNPRMLARVDGTLGSDTTYRADTDETLGTTFALNLTPIAFSPVHAQARALLQRYLELLRCLPGRGAVHLSQASFELGYSPCLLPANWCVCSPSDYESPHIWSNPIALHVGHVDVEPRWKIEATRSNLMKRASALKNRIRILLK